MSSLSTFYNFPLSQPSLHGAAGTALTGFRSPETDSRKIPDNPTQDKRRKGRFRRGLSSPFQNHTGSSEKASLRAAPLPSSPPSGGPSDSGCGADPPLPPPDTARRGHTASFFSAFPPMPLPRPFCRSAKPHPRTCPGLPKNYLLIRAQQKSRPHPPCVRAPLPP